MGLYKYYKGTEKQTTMYNAWVSFNKKYKGTTEQWSMPFERDGNWYVMKNDDYPSDEMEEVSELPKVEFDEIN